MTHPPQSSLTPSSERRETPSAEPPNPKVYRPEYVAPVGPWQGTDFHELLAASAEVSDRLKKQVVAGYTDAPLPYSPMEIVYALTQIQAGWAMRAAAEEKGSSTSALTQSPANPFTKMGDK